MIQPVRGIKFLKTKEGHNLLKGFILNMSVLIMLGCGYFSIIFFPVMNQVQKMHPKTMDEMIIFTSMLGFVCLSLFFVVNWLLSIITVPINKKLGWISNSLKPTLPSEQQKKPEVDQ